MNEIKPKIILASQSKPRKLLLDKLKIDFEIIPAHIDETPLPNESVYTTVERLSKSKGDVVLNKQLTKKLSTDLIIISSDQVATYKNQIYGKPGNFDNAYKQLQLFKGKTIEFITGLSIIKYQCNTNKHESIYCHEISKVTLKMLTDQQITSYLNKEQPFNSAASFQLENLGISLVDKIETNDWNAIIGLPILKLIEILNKLNLDILSI